MGADGKQKASTGAGACSYSHLQFYCIMRTITHLPSKFGRIWLVLFEIVDLGGLTVFGGRVGLCLGRDRTGESMPQGLKPLPFCAARETQA
jgi:hypothetical protein